VKVDLWKCDRCPATRENAVQLGLPTGWQTIALTGDGKPREKHLCEKCNAEFMSGLSGT